jgi:hypothetical protein
LRRTLDCIRQQQVMLSAANTDDVCSFVCLAGQRLTLQTPPSTHKRGVRINLRVYGRGWARGRAEAYIDTHSQRQHRDSLRPAQADPQRRQLGRRPSHQECRVDWRAVPAACQLTCPPTLQHPPPSVGRYDRVCHSSLVERHGSRWQLDLEPPTHPNAIVKLWNLGRA